MKTDIVDKNHPHYEECYFSLKTIVSREIKENDIPELIELIKNNKPEKLLMIGGMPKDIS
jgi:hypothetical protein